MLAACSGETPRPSSTSTTETETAAEPPVTPTPAPTPIPTTPTGAPPTSVARPQASVPALGLDRHRIAVGTERACLITREGDVACFDTSATPWIAHRVPSFVGATSVAVGRRIACVVDTDRRVQCIASDGSLGLGATASPVPSLTEVEAVAIEREAVCARDAGGHVHCFGRSPRDRGAAHAFDVELPARAIQIAAADDGLCVLVEDGRVFCYGDVGNSTAYFGSTTSPRVVPVEAAAALSMSADHLCVRTLEGDDALCAGAIGDWFYEDVDFEDDERGPVSQLEMPVSDFSLVDGLDATLALASTADHACARMPGGRVACWGASYRDGRHEGFVARRASTLHAVDELVAGGGDDRGVTCAVSSERPVCFATTRVLTRGTPGEGALPVCDGDAQGEGCTELTVPSPSRSAPTASTAAPTPAAPAPTPAVPAPTTCTVADPSGTPLNVRSEASTRAEVVGTLENGTEVQSDEARGRFRHLTAPVVGWAWSDALSCP